MRYYKKNYEPFKSRIGSATVFLDMIFSITLTKTSLKQRREQTKRQKKQNL